MIFTLNLGTNLVNSWCQLLSVEAGEIIKKGPQMFSLWNRKTGLANCRKTENIYFKIIINYKSSLRIESTL